MRSQTPIANSATCALPNQPPSPETPRREQRSAEHRLRQVAGQRALPDGGDPARAGLAPPAGGDPVAEQAEQRHVAQPPEQPAGRLRHPEHPEQLRRDPQQSEVVQRVQQTEAPADRQPDDRHPAEQRQMAAGLLQDPVPGRPERRNSTAGITRVSTPWNSTRNGQKASRATIEAG